MTILVTGGGGFLGKGIVTALIKQGHQVRSLARGFYPELHAMGVETLQGDIASYADVKAAAEGCHSLFHVAAKAGIRGPYAEYYAANVQGTQNVIKACDELGIANLVYTSSPSVIFDGKDQEGLDESAPYPQRFLAHYPHTKSLAEMAIMQAHRPGLATVSLRPHLIWGPGDRHIIPRIWQRARQDRLRLVGSAGKKIDAVYIDNAVHAHVLAWEKLKSAPQVVGGKTYFITNHEPWTHEDVINGFLHAGGLPPVSKRISSGMAYGAGALCEAVYGLARIQREPPITRFMAKQLATAHWYDNAAAIRDLGYRPLVSMAEGMARLRGSVL